MSNTQTKKPKKLPNKIGKNRKTRDEKGRFIKGIAPNPKGRPKGSGLSITSLVKKELEKCPEGEDKKTYADLIVKRILSKAIKDGDTRMIEKIWAYMDGMPKQKFEGDVNLNINKLLDDLSKPTKQKKASGQEMEEESSLQDSGQGETTYNIQGEGSSTTV